MLIELKDIKKTYGTGEAKVEAVRGVTIGIMENDFIALCGPSGSGKSTFLSVTAGLLHPTEGEVIVDEISLYRDLDSDGLARFRNEYVGFVFQSFQLVPYLTIAENVMLPLAPISTLTKREKQEMAEQSLADVGLPEKKRYLPQELSGGQKQRVAIARALVNDPPVIFADEPTGNLDTDTRDDILSLFAEIRKKGRTIVMVTHDPENITYANRVVRIQDGLIHSDCNENTDIEKKMEAVAR